MAGQTFTVKEGWGTTNGPSYTGQKSVAPPTNGNVAVNIDAVVFAGNAPVTVYSNDIPVAKIEAVGLNVLTAALNGNANTPAVSVAFKNAGAGGNTDVTFALAAGRSPGYPTAAAAGIISNTTSITVTPDPVSDVAVNITVMLDS